MIEDTLTALELKLLTSDVRRSKLQLAEILHNDFFEIGSSGRTYNKEQVIESLLHSSNLGEAKIRDFRVRENGILAHVSYRLSMLDDEGGLRYSLRSSVWKYECDDWLMLFHQGTASND